MTAVTNPNPVYLHPAVQADALAEALNQLGFTTAVMKQRIYHPCVVVKCGPGRHVGIQSTSTLRQSLTATANGGSGARLLTMSL